MFRALLFAGLDIFQLGNTMMHLFTETLIRAASLQNGIVSEGSMVYSALLLVGLVLLLDVIESNWIRGRAEISGHSKQEISFISSLKAAWIGIRRFFYQDFHGRFLSIGSCSAIESEMTCA